MSTDVRPPTAAAPRHRVHVSRRARTVRVVWLFSLLVVLACVGWAVLVQVAVPDACTSPVPPPRAQYLHC